MAIPKKKKQPDMLRRINLPAARQLTLESLRKSRTKARLTGSLVRLPGLVPRKLKVR